MASGVTNRGKTVWADGLDAAAVTFTIRLATDAVTPNADTNTFSQLTEVSNGNGYTTGGQAATLGAASEDDANDRADIAVNTFSYTASGGSISNIRYVCLVDNSGNLLAWFDEGSNITITSGNTRTWTGFTVRFA